MPPSLNSICFFKLLLEVVHDTFTVLYSDIMPLMNIVQVTLLWGELGVNKM